MKKRTHLHSMSTTHLSIATVLQGVQDPPIVPHSPASTQVKPLLGTRQVWQLAKWLETETLHFNQTFSERALSSPALEFLLLATRSARQLHSKAFYELTKQVGCALSVACVRILHQEFVSGTTSHVVRQVCTHEIMVIFNAALTTRQTTGQARIPLWLAWLVQINNVLSLHRSVLSCFQAQPHM